MHTHEPHEQEPIDTSKGYEQSDARVSGVFVFLVVLGIMAVVIGGIAFGLGKFLNRQMATEDGPTSRWVHPVDTRTLGNMASNTEMQQKIAEQTQSFPAPRVQIDDGNQDVADLHLREDLLLDNYSWADQSQGKVRIPIERAMELLAARGLPVAPAAEQSLPMTGDEQPLIAAPLTSGFARTGYELDQAAAMGSQR